MLTLNLTVLLATVVLVHFTAALTDKVICYYESWSSTFAPSDIDVKICTHVNYAFLGINSNGSLRLDDNGATVIKKVKNLKKKNSKLKLMFSIGGWSEGSKIFSDVAADSVKRNQMISSALQFLRKYKFDGIDIDWEYPSKRGGKFADKKNFISLLQTLYKELKDNDFLLSIAVESTPNGKSYDVLKIVEYIDFINVMTYDFGPGGITSENAPLYASSKDSKWERENENCDAAIKNWISKGAPSSKLNLGLAFYGHSYTLKDSNNNSIHAPISEDNGQLSYSEICKDTTGWKVVWNEEQKVPYKYKEFTWIGYDDPISIKLKVQYAKNKKLGGVMIWAVNQDDKSGSCGTKMVLLKTIKKNL